MLNDHIKDSTFTFLIYFFGKDGCFGENFLLQNIYAV